MSLDEDFEDNDSALRRTLFEQTSEQVDSPYSNWRRYKPFDTVAIAISNELSHVQD